MTRGRHSIYCAHYKRETGGAGMAAVVSERRIGARRRAAGRMGGPASRIADEVIAHLSGLVGATVTVTLEVEAHIPSGHQSMSCVRSLRTAGR